jgi:hypothetical protein
MPRMCKLILNPPAEGKILGSFCHCSTWKCFQNHRFRILGSSKSKCLAWTIHTVLILYVWVQHECFIVFPCKLTCTWSRDPSGMSSRLPTNSAEWGLFFTLRRYSVFFEANEECQTSLVVPIPSYCLCPVACLCSLACLAQNFGVRKDAAVCFDRMQCWADLNPTYNIPTVPSARCSDLSCFFFRKTALKFSSFSASLLLRLTQQAATSQGPWFPRCRSGKALAMHPQPAVTEWNDMEHCQKNVVWANMHLYCIDAFHCLSLHVFFIWFVQKDTTATALDKSPPADRQKIVPYYWQAAS